MQSTVAQRKAAPAPAPAAATAPPDAPEFYLVPEVLALIGRTAAAAA